VYACGEPASTRELIARVRDLGVRDARRYGELMSAQAGCALSAAAAVKNGDQTAFVDALRGQRRALERLGHAAGAPIVTEALAALADLAESADAAFLPAGAGGGDVALYVASTPPDAAFRRRAAELGFSQLDVRLGARGVHAADS